MFPKATLLVWSMLLEADFWTDFLIYIKCIQTNYSYS